MTVNPNDLTNGDWTMVTNWAAGGAGRPGKLAGCDTTVTRQDLEALAAARNIPISKRAR